MKEIRELQAFDSCYYREKHIKKGVSGKKRLIFWRREEWLSAWNIAQQFHSTM